MKDGNIVGISLGMKLVNSKFKPKYGSSGIVFVIFVPTITLIFLGVLIYGIMNMDIEMIAVPSITIFCLGYIMFISPYFQSSKNYYIKFESEDSLNNFELFYKNKKVNVQYKIAHDGKIAFLKNNNKLECLSYHDGSKMSTFTKYKIINYFTKWLSDNKLLSNEVATTFEKI